MAGTERGPRVYARRQTAPGPYGRSGAPVETEQQPHASYFVFRKPLEVERDAKVIGIDYNLVEEPAFTRSIPPRNSRTQPKSRTPARVPVEKRTPPNKRFIVLVRRTAVIESANTVEAETKAEAREQAVALARKEPFDVSKAIVKVEGIDVRS